MLSWEMDTQSHANVSSSAYNRSLMSFFLLEFGFSDVYVLGIESGCKSCID